MVGARVVGLFYIVYPLDKMPLEIQSSPSKKDSMMMLLSLDWWKGSISRINEKRKIVREAKIIDGLLYPEFKLEEVLQDTRIESRSRC